MSPFEKPRPATIEEKEAVFGTKKSPHHETAKSIANLLKGKVVVATLPYSNETLNEVYKVRNKLYPFVRDTLSAKRIYTSVQPTRGEKEKFDTPRDGFIAFSTKKLSRKKSE